ncbi:hypothetical protein VP01_3295g1 [Puccinia sorghi]|uniref:Uncharacterized protein n=1 Tax=Puccinia sorghi TaxID=27349 RepID=A0A0L6UXP6_9BASI|nr:hypothetical protein VP01_3295g1 [Puccinia sorghi]
MIISLCCGGPFRFQVSNTHIYIFSLYAYFKPHSLSVTPWLASSSGLYLYFWILFHNLHQSGFRIQSICGQSAFRIQFSSSDQPQLTVQHRFQSSCSDQSEHMIQLKPTRKVQTPTRKIASIKFHTSKNASSFTIKGGPLPVQHPIIPGDTSSPQNRQEIPLPHILKSAEPVPSFSVEWEFLPELWNTQLTPAQSKIALPIPQKNTAGMIHSAYLIIPPLPQNLCLPEFRMTAVGPAPIPAIKKLGIPVGDMTGKPVSEPVGDISQIPSSSELQPNGQDQIQHPLETSAKPATKNSGSEWKPNHHVIDVRQTLTELLNRQVSNLQIFYFPYCLSALMKLMIIYHMKRKSTIPPPRLDPTTNMDTDQIQGFTQSDQLHDVAHPDVTERLIRNVPRDGENKLDQWSAPGPRFDTFSDSLNSAHNKKATNSTQLKRCEGASDPFESSPEQHEFFCDCFENNEIIKFPPRLFGPIGPSRKTSHHINPLSEILCSTNPRGKSDFAPSMLKSSLKTAILCPSLQPLFSTGITGESLTLPSKPTGLSGQDAPEVKTPSVNEDDSNALPIASPCPPNPISSTCLASPTSFHQAPSLPPGAIFKETSGFITVNVATNASISNVIDLTQVPQTHLGQHSDPILAIDVNFGLQLLMMVRTKRKFKSLESKSELVSTISGGPRKPRRARMVIITSDDKDNPTSSYQVALTLSPVGSSGAHCIKNGCWIVDEVIDESGKLTKADVDKEGCEVWEQVLQPGIEHSFERGNSLMVKEPVYLDQDLNQGSFEGVIKVTDNNIDAIEHIRTTKNELKYTAIRSCAYTACQKGCDECAAKNKLKQGRSTNCMSLHASVNVHVIDICGGLMIFNVGGQRGCVTSDPRGLRGFCPSVRNRGKDRKKQREKNKE